MDIGFGTQIKLNANLKLRLDIKGVGILKIQSKQNTYIDAEGHTIPKLLIQTQKKTSLVSELKIKEEVTIIQGKLILNINDLILNENVKIDPKTLDCIEENMGGKIRVIKQYIFVALRSSFQAETNLQNFMVNNLIIEKNFFQIKNRGRPQQRGFYQEPSVKLEPPPQKKNSINKFINNKKCIV